MDGTERANGPARIADSVFATDSLVQAAHLLGDNPILIVEWQTRRILACNDAVFRVFGYEPAELFGQTTRPLHVSEEAYDTFGTDSEQHVLDGASTYRCHYRMRRRNGEDFPTENLLQVIHDGDEGPVGVISVVRDLAESLQVEAAESETTRTVGDRLARYIPSAMFERVRTPDGDDRYTFVAGRLLDEYGLDVPAARSDPATVFDLIDAHDRAVFESALTAASRSLAGIDMVLRFRPPDGGTVWLRVVSRPHRLDDGTTVWNGLAIDVTREKLAESQAHWLATHDNLTGLVNRTQFTEHLDRSVAAAGVHGRHLAVAQVGIRGMLRINEAHGFAAGDAVLMQFAERLRPTLSQGDVVARSHGDIFLVMLQMAESDADLGGAIRMLRQSCAEPYDLGDGITVRVGLTIGVARFPEDGRSADTLLSAAALAADRARRRPDVEYDFYARDLSTDMRRRFRTESLLRDAIAEERLEPHFQPQWSLADRALVGFEALVRWPLEDGGMVSPAEFIPLAEESGVIRSLGRLMLRRVAQQVKTWSDDGLTVPPIAVNCSAQQFRVEDFVDVYCTEVIDQGVDPELVALEITESTLLDDFVAAQRTMVVLAERGVHFSIDDFGTGFSSLGYLTQLPFHVLKIDRGFVAGVSDDARQHSIVQALIQMATALDLYVIAEGIETAEQEAEMHRLGCPAGQGFYYSAAVPAHEAAGWLA